MGLGECTMSHQPKLEVLGAHQSMKALPQISSGPEAVFFQTRMTGHMRHTLKWTQLVFIPES